MDRWRALVAGLDPTYVVIGAVVAAVLVVATSVVLLLRRRRRRRSDQESAAGGASDRPDHGATLGLDAGLAKTRAGLRQRLLPLLGLNRLDSNARDELETALLGADVGVRMTERLLQRVERGGDRSGSTVRDRLKEEVLAILEAPRTDPGAGDSPKPWVVMMVGVNGVGKTTTVGKLAARFVRDGRRTMMVAADTFRAAAIEQLAIWAERTGTDLVRHQHGGDPGAVVHDGMRAALARDVDVVIVDTAGRLHTKSNLMEELRKVRRVMAREIPGAPHETLLVVDAVTGQNGLAQGRAFLEQLDVTGVVLTKLDGTAKGGVVVAIAGELGLPIRYVGVGERVEDLRDFDAAEFTSGLFGSVE